MLQTSQATVTKTINSRFHPPAGTHRTAFQGMKHPALHLCSSLPFSVFKKSFSGAASPASRLRADVRLKLNEIGALKAPAGRKTPSLASAIFPSSQAGVLLAGKCSLRSLCWGLTTSASTTFPKKHCGTPRRRRIGAVGSNCRSFYVTRVRGAKRTGKCSSWGR